ncbi:plasminogen-like [Branchiostoma floridae]|uniref:Plasminogen-like n=1 Tax=Branchiostoma floridae TaxID=7739 RepID=A0A9J7HSA9_BRAFL|nr:plasminogen-like [Branchiostoma floridae]
MAAGIVVLLSLVAVGLAPLTFINKEEISELSTAFNALKREQDEMSTTVDALKRNQDDMRQLSTTVDSLKRDFDASKRRQDDLSTTVNALKHDLDKERNQTIALEPRLHEMSKKLHLCQEGDGSSYRGTVSVTKTGKTCQRWDTLVPHVHHYGPVYRIFHPSDGLKENYCRNPGREGTVGVWCYTTDPGTRWEYCDVPVCGAV